VLVSIKMVCMDLRSGMTPAVPQLRCPQDLQATDEWCALPCCAVVQVQWRFVNRAIDEVENGNVPAVLLVCR
jgi:hypothetical protein